MQNLTYSSIQIEELNKPNRIKSRLPVVTEPLRLIITRDPSVPLSNLKDLDRKSLGAGGYWMCLVVLERIAFHWNEASEMSFPSAQTIAKESGVGEYQIYPVLSALQHSNLITPVERRQKGRVTRWKFEWYGVSTDEVPF